MVRLPTNFMHWLFKYILNMMNILLYSGIGLIVGGFILFIISEMRLRQLDIELFKNEQLLKSFNKAKEKKWY